MSALNTIQLKEIINSFNLIDADLECFIETGTFKGQTSIQMSSCFKKVITIEISEALYSRALKKFKNYPNIEPYLGDSSIKLNEVLAGNELDSIIFFLDGHYSSGNTGKGKIDCPLLEELLIISKRNKSDLIIIDDYRLFGTKRKEDWSYISVDKILNCFKKDQILKANVFGDRFCILTQEV